MRRYETIFITDPELPDDEVNGLVASFSGVISDRQGDVLKSEDWGRKKLAYEVRKRREGRYLRLEYTCNDPTLPHEVERRMRMTEPVIKYLTVRIDDEPHRLVWEKKQEAKEKARAARRAREEAEARARAEAAGEAKEQASAGSGTAGGDQPGSEEHEEE